MFPQLGGIMRKILLSVVAALALVFGFATPASAITGNYVPDTEHPFVGLVVFYDENNEFAGRCSGSLLNSTVFLTAGHCTDGATTARVYFQQDAGFDYNVETDEPASSGYPDECAEGTLGVVCATSDELHNYGFADFAGFPDTHDVGLVILNEPIQRGEYGALAADGSLDRLATRRGTQATTFTASGYGLTYTSPVETESYRSRLMASAKLTNLRSANNDGFNLQTNGNGNGLGGTCSGDSGGPIFYGGTDSNTIVAVTSFGMNEWCRGTDFSYRIDRQEVIDWILGKAGATAGTIQVVTI
jgi:hypothetical protein